DPCTCKTYHKPGHRVRVTCRTPDQICTRQVTHHRTVCEQVPCTTMVRERVCTRVPYTVCKKVPYTVHRQVPCQVTRMGTEDAPRQVPSTVCRMVRETVTRQVPYTVTRCVRGAWVDCNGCAYDCEGPGRHFQEGAQIRRNVCTTTCRMVRET